MDDLTARKLSGLCGGRLILPLGLAISFFLTGTKMAAQDASPTPSPHHHTRKKTSSPTPESKDTPESEATATPAPSVAKTGSAPNASIDPEDLVEFDKESVAVKKMLTAALALTQQNLTYTYGSADPANGGMDCSGFVFYVLRQNGFDDVPRDASGQYVWVRKAGMFQAVLSRRRDSFELADLRPGDLLFWCGTYSVDKDPPVTHAMIYLGTEKKTHQRVMVGSSDGRSYQGKSRWGVSVFDFKGNESAANSDPSKPVRAMFVGYASIPGLR